MDDSIRIGRPSGNVLPPLAGDESKCWDSIVAGLLPRVRRELTGSIIPFWWRSIDRRHGGVFNCWNNAGTKLLSRDKFTWSQGRFLWLWSRLARTTSRGILPGDPARFLEHAEKTAAFLDRHAFLDDGRCAFLLSEAGQVKELEPGAGPAPSIYADCFVAMGLAEFAGVSGRRDVLDRAWSLAADIRRRVAEGDVPTHPYPVPAGYESHGLAMILLNVALVIEDACGSLGDGRCGRARELTVEAATRVVGRFHMPGGRIAEMRRVGGMNDDACLLDRHFNPGHSLEGTWMLVDAGVRSGRSGWVARARDAVRYGLERGWDEEHGGLLLHVDCEGGPPKGVAGSSRYEAAVLANWGAKLWWVHSEALYATLLAFRMGGRPPMASWFEKIRDYAFRVFPNPDPEVGEWIQIRDRFGRPMEQVVALPVKDPYHIARNLIQVIELCADSRTTAPGSAP